MAKIENLPPPVSDHRVANVRHFEAGPPAGLQLVGSDGETIATTKEEEWVSKKKTEVTNTKQIETRVKRQVVLEDGKIVEDSGPMVTTNTTEDTETQEHHQTESRKLGDDNDDNQKKIERIDNDDDDHNDNGKEKWISVPNPDGVVREVQEKRIVSREEIEEIKEIEDVQHHGDITDEDFLAAVHSGQDDLRTVLKTVDNDGTKILTTGPRLIRDTIKSNKIIDTENLKESSSIRPDGKIITESQRTTEHEEINDDELPENLINQSFDKHKENHQRFFKVREQEDVDYIKDGKKIGHEMKYKTEATEMERYGDDDLKHKGIDETDFDRFSQRVRKQQQQQQRRYNPNMLLTTPTTTTPLDRTDVVTRKPLDIDQEEETRKVETSKWLEHHFGSESSNQSIDNDDHDQSDLHKKQLPPKTNFFNVTIKSSPIRRTPSPIRQPDYHPIRNDYVTKTTTTANYKGISQWSSTPSPIQRQHSPLPDYDNVNDARTTPIPPQRKQRQRQQPEPPPDYSPPRNSTPSQQPNKSNDKKITRFAPITTTTSTQTKQKSGNIIGQSIRKLVGKIRSASAERKSAKQRNSKRSSSPSYQKGHIIDDNNIGSRYHQPVQRYYLGEDPFAGSIYGRENKYDGVKPRKMIDNDYRSQSTLGRFSKSTIGLINSNNNEQTQRYSQTLPRRPHQHPKYYKYETPTRLEKSTDNTHNDNTINVSIINTISTPPPPPPPPLPPSILKNEPPAKPARTYRANLSRSQSFNIHQSDNMKRINNNYGIDLKSPSLISNLSRSQRDLNELPPPPSSIDCNNQPDTRKRIFLKGLQDRAPELYHKLQENDIHETPTRLKDNHQQSIIRRNSGASSTDYSEIYHTTTHNNNNPYQPTITNTIKSYTKKTIPNNRNLTETIESKEIKSITKRYNSTSSSPTTIRTSPSPVIIEVRNNNNYYK